MLKQSLVQEKLSDLSMATAAAAKTATTSGVGTMTTTPGTSLKSANTNTLSAATLSTPNTTTNTTEYIIPHMPQWPRVKIVQLPLSSLTNSSSSKLIGIMPPLTNNENDSTESIEYDGIETVNFYSNYSARSNLNSNNNPNSSYSHSGHNSNVNENNNDSNSAYLSSNEFSQKRNDNRSGNTLNTRNMVPTESYDPTLKLRYLEKSIRFIQQQHNETLQGLHQEIEKLKTENRELHFKLATRKTSGSKSDTSSSSSIKVQNNQQHETDILVNKEEEKNFDKALKAAIKESNLDKRLNDIKLNYESSKYDELLTKLKDAESKNEYLTNIITQLQSKRSANSGYRPNVDVNNDNTSTTNLIDSVVTNTSTIKSQPSVAKLNINNIYTVEPLKIKISENDEPRAPNTEESDVLIKKLFELYNQQKQQISNMKVVLKDMMQNENLSNQAMIITKDVLDNPNKLSHYFIDNNNMPKFSIYTTMAPKSSTGRLANVNTLNTKYHSQIINLNNQMPVKNNNLIKTNSNANFSSIVHLPPLQTINPVKFPERQRRTQLLQRQRLRREYFH